MKTIAITIDEATLDILDGLLSASPKYRNRSALLRIAVRDFAEREQRREREAREGEILNRHKKRLARQAKALIAEQGRR